MNNTSGYILPKWMKMCMQVVLFCISQELVLVAKFELSYPPNNVHPYFCYTAHSPTHHTKCRLETSISWAFCSEWKQFLLSKKPTTSQNSPLWLVTQNLLHTLEIKGTKKQQQKKVHAITIDNRVITYAVVSRGQTLPGWVWPHGTTNAV